MSELYRDFIDRKADDVITALNGSITPNPGNELYRDFINRKADDVITALNGSITPDPGNELYRDFLDRKFDDVIAGIGGYVPPITFPTLTGSIVTFNSQYAGLPLKSHKVNIDSVSGVSAINISQIAVCVIDQQFELGGYRNTDGAKYNANDRLRSVNRYPVKPNMEFYLSMPTSGLWVYEYDINGTYINRYQLSARNTYTVHTGAYQIALEIYGSYGTTYNNNISLNYPSTDTSYHEYQGTQTTINIGQTVNEGEYDARTGVFLGDYDYIDLGSLTWGYTASGNRFTSSGIASVIKKPTTDSDTADVNCSIYTTMSLTDLRSSSSDNLIAVGDSGTISIRNTTYGTDANAFKTAMSGVYLKYAVASPTSLQLESCPIDVLAGVNNIWADTGDTTLQYIKIGGNN